MFGKIIGTGSYVPKEIVTNKDLAQYLDTDDTWIRERTGVKSRHISGDKETTADMAVKAAEKALENSGLLPDEIDLIIVSSVSSNLVLPSTACFVQKAINAKNAFCFDINVACTGFITAYNISQTFINTGLINTALIIGAESLSKITDWSDRKTCILFGDGAGGVLLEANPQKKLLKEKLATDGTRSTSLTAGYQQNKNPFYSEDSEGSYYLRMTGRDIFDFAVRDVANNIQEVMKDTPVDYLLLHQANLRIIEKIARKVKMPQEKFLTNMDKYGNTSAASIPILLDEAVSSGKITLGKQQKVIFTGYGGGLTWGSILMGL